MVVCTTNRSINTRIALTLALRQSEPTNQWPALARLSRTQCVPTTLWKEWCLVSSTDYWPLTYIPCNTYKPGAVFQPSSASTQSSTNMMMLLLQRAVFMSYLCVCVLMFFFPVVFFSRWRPAHPCCRTAVLIHPINRYKLCGYETTTQIYPPVVVAFW